MPNPLSFRLLIEAKQVLNTLFGVFVLIYANFYLTAHLTTVFRLPLPSLLYMTFFFWQIMTEEFHVRIKLLALL